jgi:hypothetical protein
MARYVGIDLAKRTMEVRVVDGDRIERHGLTADEKGRSILASLLRKTDVVGYEVCRFGNRLARMPEKEAGCEVIALNPGDLRIIWKRRTCGPGKKTDREDALKMRRSGEVPEGHAGGAVQHTASERRGGGVPVGHFAEGVPEEGAERGDQPVARDVRECGDHRRNEEGPERR